MWIGAPVSPVAYRISEIMQILPICSALASLCLVRGGSTTVTKGVVGSSEWSPRIDEMLIVNSRRGYWSRSLSVCGHAVRGRGRSGSLQIKMKGE